MGDDRRSNISQQEHQGIGSNTPERKSSTGTINVIEHEQEQQMEQGAQTEDKARLRLMEISKAAAPGDVVDPNEDSTSSPKASSIPRADSKDEIRHKLMSISYSASTNRSQLD